MWDICGNIERVVIDTSYRTLAGVTRGITKWSRLCIQLLSKNPPVGTDPLGGIAQKVTCRDMNVHFGRKVYFQYYKIKILT